MMSLGSPFSIPERSGKHCAGEAIRLTPSQAAGRQLRMARDMTRIRLHVDAPLASGARIVLPVAASHYLLTVMRLGAGAAIAVFNGRDGEWRARLVDRRRAGATLEVERRLRAQEDEVALWLLFAPVKRAATDLIVEKATELGATRLVPVMTARAIAERVRRERLEKIAREAAEQCGRLTLPEIAALLDLSAAAAAWSPAHPLYLCDPDAAAPPFLEVLEDASAGEPAAVLVGPEGGFTEAEREMLRRLEAVRPVSLGPRTLRAETAAIAALALMQAAREAS